MNKNSGERFNASTFTVLREHVTGLNGTGRVAFHRRWKANPQEAGREAKTSFVQRHLGLGEPWARHLVLLSEIAQARRDAEDVVAEQSQAVTVQQSAERESVSQPFAFPATHIGASGDAAAHDQAVIAGILAELGLHAEAYRLTGSPTEPVYPDVAALMAEWKRSNSRFARGTQQLFSALGIHNRQDGRFGAFFRQLFGQSGSGSQAQAEK